jgi:Activator of Hsp90 ATPase homolog 1-like protein
MSRRVGLGVGRASLRQNTPKGNKMTETAHELLLTRLIDAPREKLFRCWTDPELLKRWFAPLPFTTPLAEVDLRVGGLNRVVMGGPDGQEIDNPAAISKSCRTGSSYSPTPTPATGCPRRVSRS